MVTTGARRENAAGGSPATGASTPLRKAQPRTLPCSITEIDLPANDHGKRAKPGHDERHESKIEPVCSKVLTPPAGVILEYT